MIADNISELISNNKNAKVRKVTPFPLEIISPKDIPNGEEKINNNYYNNNYYYYFFFCGSLVDPLNHIIGIPNKYPRILDIDPETDTITQWGEVELPKGKGWTGGALASDGCVYGFPRGADSILKIDTLHKEISYKKLRHTYNEEHHYGGFMTDDDVIYQPPKNSNQVLRSDLIKKNEEELKIPGFKTKRLFYGGAMDLNGYGYFFPAGKYSKVCMVDPTGKVSLIGRMFRMPFFNSGAIAANGDIYGFSSYSDGIIHIDTTRHRAEILKKDLPGGYFGAKLGFNGKIYSIPGNSDFILEYDANTNEITDRIPLPDCEVGAKAKCAGGAVDSHGNIWCVPAMGHYIYKIEFEGVTAFPDEKLYRSLYWKSFY